MQKSEKSNIEHLELVIKATEVGIWDWQVQTGELFFNDSSADIIGYSLKELQPIQFEQWAEYIHPEDFLIANEILEKHFQGETKLFEAEVRMKHKQGQYVWVLATGKTIEWYEDGLPKRMIGIHLDITQRKNNEQKLITTSHLLEQSQKIAKVGGWELDLLSDNLFWTAETYRIHETSPEEFNPTVDAGVSYFLPESKQIITEALDAAINDGKGYDLELETYTTKGRLIDIRTTCIVTIVEGKAVKLTGIFQDISEEKSIQRTLKKSYSELESSQVQIKSLLNTVPDMIWLKDKKGVYLACNAKFARMVGAQENEIVGKTDYNFVDKELADFFRQNDKKALMAGKATVNEESVTFVDDGHSELLETIKTPMVDNNGNLIGVLGVARDITNRKLADEKLKLAASVFSHARDGIIITDAASIIVDVNDTFSQNTGYSREEAIGKNPRILQSGRQSSEFYVDMWQALLKKGYWTGEVWNRRKNGEVYAEMKTISAVRNEQGITTHYVALGYDITPMKAHQDQLERIAHYDLLTNLPNRVLLADRLSQAMLQCRRHERSLAVVFLDLDGFKAVNDAYGHNMGDELLIALSVRMKEALREDDSLARIGGDEFIAVLADLINVEDCVPVLERLLLAASEPITVGNIVLNVSASIGVTLYPQDDFDADQLMRHADQAMYVAKESGKNRYHMFDTAEDNAVKVQQESLEAIRRALDNHQFVLYYQPKVNMWTGKVTGFEALIRWQHPERGLLNPIEFLPVIENNPIMIELGEWVIDTALTQISEWQAMELNLPVSTSVNIAAIQLQQSDFTHRLTTLLAAHPDVEPHYLELEVLETSALEDVQHVSTIMNECMALGVNFALDDFGTGYSSLTYLRRLPANIIKIDQTFVRDMLNDADDLAIVEGVIALAKSFKREVIAEGVETLEHGTALLKLGCELAQGYGIARPMPASDIPTWINDWKSDANWQV